MKCGRQITSWTTRRVRRCRREAGAVAYCWQHLPGPPELSVHYDRALSLLVSEPLDLTPFLLPAAPAEPWRR